MDVHEARNLANGLIEKHLNNDWRFAYDDSTSRFGACRFGSRMIILSMHLTEANQIDQVLDTILHEIAHAKAGPKKPYHGTMWGYWCGVLGCKPQRCYSTKEVVAARKPEKITAHSLEFPEDD